MPEYILEIDAWTGASVETLPYGSKTKITAATDVPPNEEYSGRIMDAGMFQRSLQVGSTGRASTGVGSIILNNGDGALDALVNYGFDGREYRLKELANPSSPVSNAPTIARGVLAGIDSSDAWHTIRLRIRDQMASLQVPLLTARYAGTTTSTGLGTEGDTNLQDQIKPIVFGSVINMLPKSVNPFDLIYQVSQSAVFSITVYDGGAALTNAGDVPTLSALMGATIAAGSYMTCIALGIFRLGATPVFAVTADVVEGATLALRSPARVAERMLDFLGIPSADRDADSFTDLHTFNPAEVGIYIDTETNADDLIAQVLDSIGGAIVPTSEGVFRATSISAPSGASEATFNLRYLSADTALTLSQGVEGEGVPAWSVVLNWGRIWHPQAVGELAGIVTVERQNLLALEYRPAAAQDPTVKIAHPLSPSLEFNTLLTQQADATAEAARRLAMYKVRRDHISFTVPVESGRYELGAVLTVAFPRFGFNGGKLMRLIGRTDDFSERKIELELWG